MTNKRIIDLAINDVFSRQELSFVVIEQVLNISDSSVNQFVIGWSDPSHEVAEVSVESAHDQC